MHPNEGNFRAPSPIANDCDTGDESRGEHALYAYSSTTAFDSVAESLSEGDYIPDEVHASSGGMQNVPIFSPNPVPTASAMHFWAWTAASPSSLLPQHIPTVDLNDPDPRFGSPRGRPSGIYSA
jgi:hypothetical protein